MIGRTFHDFWYFKNDWLSITRPRERKRGSIDRTSKRETEREWDRERKRERERMREVQQERKKREWDIKRRERKWERQKDTQRENEQEEREGERYIYWECKGKMYEERTHGTFIFFYTEKYVKRII